MNKSVCVTPGCTYPATTALYSLRGKGKAKITLWTEKPWPVRATGYCASCLPVAVRSIAYAATAGMVEQERAYQNEHVSVGRPAPHACGMCEGELSSPMVVDGYLSWVCRTCGSWHTSKDCCDDLVTP